MVLHVVLHQLGQRGKLLSPVQVIIVPCVLDLDVGDSAVPPREKNITMFQLRHCSTVRDGMSGLSFNPAPQMTNS